MPSFALTQFETFAAATSGEQALECLFKNPGLLLTAYWPEFADWAQQLPPKQSALGVRAFNVLAGLAGQLTPDKYPFGSGPLEQIIRRLNRGEINESFARQLASAPEVYQNLSPLYIVALSMSNQRLANGGRWWDALLAQNVLLAALDARQPAEQPAQDEMEMIASIDYAVIAARSVWESADGRLFRDAVRRATAVSKVDTRPWHEPGEVEFSLGVLHLDPYIYQRTTSNFELQIAAWRRRPFEQLGPGLSPKEEQEVLMPEPREAFETASNYFLASADQRAGTDRGLSLKGHISAEIWKQAAGGQAASNLPAIAEEAIRLLADDGYTRVRAEVEGLLGLFRQSETGEPVTSPVEPKDSDWTTVARQLLEQDASQIVQQRGLYEATDLMQNVATAVADSSPELAFALWRKALPFVLQGDEATRKASFATGLGYSRRALAHPDVERFTQQSPLAGAKQCKQQAAAEQWPPQQLAATLLSIAANSQIGDREAEGIEVLQMAANADEAFTKEFLPLIVWHAGILHRGIASNMFFAGDYRPSMRNYAMAARQFLSADMPNEANEAMSLGVDIVQRSEEHLTEFIAYFSAVAPELERQGGPHVVRRVRDLARAWMPVLAKSGRLNPVVLMLLLDMAKGSTFASELQAGGSFAWIDSAESRALVDRIEQLRATPDALRQQTASAGTLRDEDLLTMYAEDEEMREGDTPAVVLHNLEIRYDAELHRKLSGRSLWQREWLPVPDKIQAALGPETVLITYYSGVTPNGNSGLYVNIITKGAITGTIVDFGIPGMQVEMNGVLADILALGVTSLRQHLNEEPDDGVMSNAARHTLEQEAAYTRGPTEQILRELHKQGKRHLCIHPHGPLHFFPFHLLPFDDGVVADQFAVTYLPNLELFNPAHASAPLRDQPIASFGIEFKNGVPHRLPELPGAEEEARLVAAAYGETAMTGAAATETALIAALTGARRIHIATHGLHSVSAPSFQRIYLSPDASSDGILYAYELLRYDLRGLDLLTLSACETGLGRVDIGDNLRGLPANALIVGAATVVGTLWPVENATAKTFFGLLHQALAAGSGKREAFQSAQRGTRAKHPEFRDWGAFWYSGRW